MFLSTVVNFVRGASRRPLLSKYGPRNFYKGVGAHSVGKVDNKGRFRVDFTKITQYIVPDLNGFALKPYVSHAAPKTKVKPPTVDDYLALFRGPR
ncbi:hypothetical protein H696_05495 [Fonticula alba]|uniref:Uncharacterized protein n=1 Tax=Fonticula alba TaxID=691883 RepID=A0A058Z3F5_FONAL|nr:hypothetical protein H696_05495 [Fonticula alba]KCV68027.1 hypothetical protein H696_05495 [Fonticula alba]|eukprot:XP_009497594.1 hypothetical protein H696_05495 [Fonticula alba]